MFEYRRLDHRGSGFRLVRLQKGDGVLIECELIHTTLDDNVIPYEAVSYTWGTLKREKYVYVAGEILPVTSNLWQVLYDLRSPDVDRYLWVDGVCINQDDDFERGHQVQQMKHIYQGADRGIFYLSPHTAIIQVIMESLTMLQKEAAGSRWAPNDERWDAAWQTVQAGMRSQYDDFESRQREGLAHLLLSPFFRRVWILQEVASVRRASVFCGKSSIPAHIFAIGARFQGYRPNAHISAIIELMQKSLDNTTNPLQGKDLAALLIQFSESEASDERDIIYALLGLCDTRENIKALTPNYTHSVAMVIRRTLNHIYGGPFLGLLRDIRTVHMLIDQLKKPISAVLESLVKGDSPEELFDYINGMEAPIEVSHELAIKVLTQIVRSSRWPIRVLRKIFAWPGVHFDVISHKVVSAAMGRRWTEEVLDLLCQNGRKVSVLVNNAFFILEKRHNTKVLKMLIELYKTKVVIEVSMRGLWMMPLLLTDDDTKAAIPLLRATDSRTEAAIAHLSAAVSLRARPFRNRDAVMLLWKFTGDAKSRHNNHRTLTKSRVRLRQRRRMSLNINHIEGEYKGTVELTSSNSERPVNIDSQLDLSPTEKWLPDMSDFNSSSNLSGFHRSQSI